MKNVSFLDFSCITLLLMSTLLLAGCSKDNNDMGYINDSVIFPGNNDSQVSEEELTSFSTKIEVDDPDRNKNISLSCEKLNGTIVKPGETFSFTDTVGDADPEEGYEKADVFNSKGDVVQGYGGGNCQISSTLYNAVLETPNLKVVERHPHGEKVTYVPKRERCHSSLWES